MSKEFINGLNGLYNMAFGMSEEYDLDYVQNQFISRLLNELEDALEKEEEHEKELLDTEEKA